MARVTIDLDLPPDVSVTGYERYGDGHGFEVAWPLPTRCRCDRCGREDDAHLEFRTAVQAVRDLDLWGQPSFWLYQPPFHRCAWCHHRQAIIPPFKRKDVSYTYRFEQLVLRLLIGSNETEVARRLGIAAETVAHIVRLQLKQARPLDPSRKIWDVGMDELSLKKRHQLYATILTDLTDPDHPEVLAVVDGRDEAAGRACLERLSPEQRNGVLRYRVDMGAAYNKACDDLLPNAQGVIDRFHVAQLFNKAVDGLRKKNHAGVPGGLVESGTEGLSVVSVGVPPGPGDADAGGTGAVAEAVHPAAPPGEAVPGAAALSGDF